MKFDLSDDVNLNIGDISKLEVEFPTRPGCESLIVFPLVLSMGWENNPPIFSTATKTNASLANASKLSHCTH